jgi:hypothetical protein
MDCSLIQERLVAYHLATVDDGEREEIDAHLIACTDCLRAYLKLKHDLDRGARMKPSPALRARLRADVERLVRPSGLSRARTFLRRPIPLYQGVAVAAALVIAILAALAVPGRSGTPGSAPALREATQHVDTARESFASLNLY